MNYICDYWNHLSQKGIFKLKLKFIPVGLLHKRFIDHLFKKDSYIIGEDEVGC